MQLTPLTELEAVNSILAAINESPVNTLEDLQDGDAINALKILRMVNRQFQSRGWSFNTFDNYALTPDVYTNKITWLDTLLYIKGTDGNKYIKRGNFLFDLTNNTYFFDRTIYASVILHTNFEDMPDQARGYILAKASTEFAMRYLGDDSLVQGLHQREQEAWMYFNDYEMTNNDYNMLENTYISGIKQR